MLNAVKSVLADVWSISPSSEQRPRRPTHSLQRSAYPHQPCVDTLYVLTEFSLLIAVFVFFFSKLSIVTRHSSQTAGTKLEYDHNGKLVSKSPCARECGTTVTLQNLFSTLPVRHKEFLRNIKKELTKLVHVLHGYCLVSTEVRISCSNQVEKGKKTTLVSTSGGAQVKDNITCIFGPKQVCHNYWNVGPGWVDRSSTKHVSSTQQ